ncbi:hypothetical protein FIV34_09220 [Luteibacter pinisoli]|uniref:Uncharacterized protein n=1 Tax=Luteibacter pinisoli TaxID=2589080 RepID=A0A4Y5Z2B4_9GAMM|nr:hypothetical protein [Luteibacter pinisoli]QDE39371.1 hypothetical protein FIV34_09220 [Luteibacter pinisoli]
MDSKQRHPRTLAVRTAPAGRFHPRQVTVEEPYQGRTTALGPLALSPPKINGRDEGRLGYAELLGSLDKLVFVTCNSSNIIYPPATAELYWGVDGAGEAKLLDSIVIPSETDSVTFAVPGRLVAGTADPTSHRYTGDGVHSVFVRLRYESSFDDSPEVTATVKCSEPGGPDPVGATRDINENLPKPTITPSPIPDASTPVWVIVEHYDVREIGDRITFEWGGPRHAFFQVVDSASGAISVQVPPEMIADVGGGRIPVSYYVTDAVGNWSKYAPYADPDVDIDPGTLTAPQLFYLHGTAVTSLLDLDTVGSDSVIVRVPTRSLSMGDIVNAEWEATLPDGTLKKYSSSDLVFDDEDSQFFLDAVIDNRIAREAAGGTVKIWYVVKGTGAIAKRRTYKVSELPDRVLLAPTVPQSDGATLDPFAVGSYVTVNVPFDPAQMALGDSVTLIVIGKRGAASSYWSDTLQLSSGDLSDPIPFYCPPKVLQDVENGEATFYYELASPRAVSADGAAIYATARESAKLTLQIRRAGAIDLPPPIVTDVKDGALDPDLPQTHVQIPNSAAALPGKEATLNWSGKVPYSARGIVPSTGLLDFRVTAPYIDGNRDSNVTATYTIDRMTSAPLTFVVGSADVPLPELSQPSVKQASGASLDPVHAKDALTVLVPAYGWKENDRLVVKWIGAGGEGDYTSSELELTTAGPWDVPVPPRVVAFNLGRTVMVSYTVYRGTSTQDSPVLLLTVQWIRQDDLPAPHIVEAVDGVLDVSKLVAKANGTMTAYPLIAEGQRVWLRVYGTKKDGTSYQRDLWVGHAVDATEVSQGFNFEISKADLDTLKESSTLRIEVKATFDKTSSEGNAVLFPASLVTIAVSEPDVYEDFNTLSDHKLLQGQPFQAGKLLLTITSGSGWLLEGRFFLEYGDRVSLMLNWDTCLITLPGSYRSIRFGCINERSSRDPSTVKLIDSKGSVIDTVIKPYPPDSGMMWFAYTSRGEKISAIEITGGGEGRNFYDNFTLSQSDLSDS